MQSWVTVQKYDRYFALCLGNILQRIVILSTRYTRMCFYVCIYVYIFVSVYFPQILHSFTSCRLLKLAVCPRASHTDAGQQLKFRFITQSQNTNAWLFFVFVFSKDHKFLLPKMFFVVILISGLHEWFELCVIRIYSSGDFWRSACITTIVLKTRSFVAAFSLKGYCRNCCWDRGDFWKLD